MDNETSVKLQIYYGELMQELETTYCYLRKRTIKKKMDEINILLDLASL